MSDEGVVASVGIVDTNCPMNNNMNVQPSQPGQQKPRIKEEQKQYIRSDYSAIIHEKLNTKNLSFIWQAIKLQLERNRNKEENEAKICQLLDWSKKDITKLIDKINAENNSNMKQIGIVIKYEFANIINSVSQLKDRSQTSPILIFLGVEEQKAISVINMAREYIINSDTNMEQLKVQLSTNYNQSLKQLNDICLQMHHTIDEKQQEIQNMIENIFGLATDKLNFQQNMMNITMKDMQKVMCDVSFMMMCILNNIRKRFLFF